MGQKIAIHVTNADCVAQVWLKIDTDRQGVDPKYLQRRLQVPKRFTFSFILSEFIDAGYFNTTFLVQVCQVCNG